MVQLQKTFATVLGIVLLLVGIIGFWSAPVFGWFGMNTLLSLVHVVAGILGLMAGLTAGGKNSKMFNTTFGAIYLVIAVVGFLNISFFTNLLMLNTADNVLHAIIGVVALGIGLWVEE